MILICDLPVEIICFLVYYTIDDLRNLNNFSDLVIFKDYMLWSKGHQLWYKSIILYVIYRDLSNLSGLSDPVIVKGSQWSKWVR